MPMIDTSFVVSPSFARKLATQSAEAEPAAVTPTFSPFRSFGDL